MRIQEGKAKAGSIPPLWDGHASERIAKVLLQHEQAMRAC
jgi:hypothetical protein